MELRSLALLILLLSAFTVSSSYSATLTVTKTGDTNDGVCDFSDCSLREAVNVSASGDTVVFSPLFNSPQTITLIAGQIIIDKNLTIAGTGQNLVTVSGNNSSRIFFITAGIGVGLSGLTLRDGDGSAAGAGGAIWVDRSALNVTNVTFTNNRVFSQGCSCGLGAAIFALDNSTLNLSRISVYGNVSPRGRAISEGGSGGGSMTVTDSLIKENTGGGINSTNVSITRCVISDHNFGGVSAVHLFIVDSIVTNNSELGGLSDGDSTSTMTIEHCLISGNSRIRPGGGLLSSGMTIVRDTRITNNSAVSGGGGIANLGTLYLLNSVVSGNRSTSTGFEDGGGGIEHSSGVLFVIDSTVSGNTALGNPGLGGGIYNLVSAGTGRGRVNLVNSTIANNTSLGAGGGIRIDVDGLGSFSNTIVAGNTSNGTSADDVSGAITSNGINLIGNTTGSSGWIKADILNRDPFLGPLGNNGGSTLSHALIPGSPAINGGSDSLAVDPITMLPLKRDQRGRERFVEGRVDIGAYESLYSSSPVTVSGRMTTYTGRGIESTRIKIEDGQGYSFYTQTNPFGYYKLVNLVPGTTYTITLTNKLYLFPSPQFFTADQDRTDLNFITSL